MYGSRHCWVHRTPSYGLHFVRSWTSLGGQLLACLQPVLCQVFYGLPTGAILSTSTPAHAFTLSGSSFCSTCRCHLSLHLLLTSPVASTTSLLCSLVFGCFLFSETPHIHLIILISIFSIFVLVVHFLHQYNKHLLIIAM